jgi:hypothetical protein
MLPDIAGSWRGEVADRGTRDRRFGRSGYKGNRPRVCKLEYIINGDKKTNDEKLSLWTIQEQSVSAMNHPEARVNVQPVQVSNKFPTALSPLRIWVHAVGKVQVVNQLRLDKVSGCIQRREGDMSRHPSKKHRTKPIMFLLNPKHLTETNIRERLKDL